MRRSFSVMLALAAIAGAAEVASAETIEVAVKRNTATVIGSRVNYFPETCTAAAIEDVVIARQGQNGRLTISRQVLRMPENALCPGVEFKGLVYIYQPRSGFVGRDSVVIRVPTGRFEYSGGRDDKVYEITVQ